jgi:iron(III) transport system permease protein
MIWGLRSSRTVVLAAAATVFVVVCVLPTLYMVSAIAGAPEPLGLMRSALLDSRQRGLLYTTIVLGVGTAALATAVGTVLGFVLARITLPFATALRIALVVPAALPPYVIALACMAILPGIAFTLGGAILALAVAFYPLSMLATEVAFRRIDPHLEEAALLVTSPNRVLRHISWPLAMPVVLSAALAIFVLAVSEFSVPGLLRVRVFTTEVFSAFASLYDFGRASVLSLPLLLTSLLVAGAATTGLGHPLLATRRSVGGRATEAFESWRNRGVAAVGSGVLLLCGAPLAALVREALRAPSIGAVMWSSRDAAINSLILASVAATAVTALATVLGYGRARAHPKRGAALDVLWVMLFTVPSTVIGIGLIGIWNRPGIVGRVYGTPAMLLLAYLARFVPVGALAMAAAVRSVPQSHEEAAATAGAAWMRTAIGIVLPQVRIALLAVWVIAFMLAFGEVGASILVAPPGESTLPIRVYTLTANAPPGHVAALALFQAAVILCPLALLGLVLARREAL